MTMKLADIKNRAKQRRAEGQGWGLLHAARSLVEGLKRMFKIIRFFLNRMLYVNISARS